MIVEFSVAYSREEYLSIVMDHILAFSRETAKKKNPDKEVTSNFWFTRQFTRAFGSLVYFYKVRKMPVCEFSFSPERITRKTALGTIAIDWSEIINIVEYTDGMIIVLDSGGLPIPYRCISDEERQWILGTQKEVSERNLTSS